MSRRATQQDDDQRVRDLSIAGLSLGASLVSAFVLSKAVWASVLLLPTAFFGFRWLLTFGGAGKLPSRWRLTGAVLLTLLADFIAWHSYLKDQYRQQQAALTEGDLVPQHDDGTQGNTKYPIVRIGFKGKDMTFATVGPMFNFAPDDAFTVTKGEQGIFVTTPVRDRNGNLVREIIDNHWRVFPPYCSDKNYDRHSLEIKDAGGSVVFQMSLFDDYVVIQGIWKNTDRTTAELISSGIFNLGNGPTIPIPPLFRYRSSQHWGETVKNADR